MKVLLSALLLIAGLVSADDGPLVETPLGKVRGHTLTSRSGRQYVAFSGVPFAKPPAGELRFQAPEPASLWRGIKDATKDGAHCIQYNPYFDDHGAEDCLFLDVFTHNVSWKAPVLVHFHGGGFIIGNKDMVRPTFLMDEDIVVVSTNYRVGIFGFLTFETKDLSGNQGLKDQTMALRWVKQNIASFGGDPRKVTIIGCSAGGASVYSHLVSPLSRGLFHRAVASSGATYCPWALSPPGLARENAEKLMSLLDCPTDPKEAIPCVMEKDAREIVNMHQKFIVFQDFDPILTFSPVLEEPGQGAFLVAPVSKFEHNPVPLMMIISSAEGLFRALHGIEGNRSISELSERFMEVGPVSLHYWASASRPKEIIRKVWDYYFSGKKEISMADFANITRMYSDSWFNHGIIKGANNHKGDVYFLWYDYVFKGAPWENMNEGANHCSDFSFIWEINFPNFLNQSQDFKEKELEISQNMVKMIVRFMDTGVGGTPGGSLKWKTWTSEAQNYLQLDKSGFSMKKTLLEERFKFWENLNFQDKLL